MDLLENNEEPEITSKDEIANIIQALVFASTDIVNLRKLRDVIGDFLDASILKDCIIIANENLNSINSPFEIVEQAKGIRFRTKKRYQPWIKKMFGADNQARKLSQAALETLSIVAYKQPITKAEVESVRGVSCDGPLRSLIDRKLIALGGRSESVGQAFQYITTKDFLKYFGLNKIPDDLPRLNELDNLIHANELVPQIKDGKMITPTRDDNPNQVELTMGES